MRWINTYRWKMQCGITHFCHHYHCKLEQNWKTCFVERQATSVLYVLWFMAAFSDSISSSLNVQFSWEFTLGDLMTTHISSALPAIIHFLFLSNSRGSSKSRTFWTAYLFCPFSRFPFSRSFSAQPYLAYSTSRNFLNILNMQNLCRTRSWTLMIIVGPFQLRILCDSNFPSWNLRSLSM